MKTKRRIFFLLAITTLLLLVLTVQAKEKEYIDYVPDVASNDYLSILHDVEEQQNSTRSISSLNNSQYVEVIGQTGGSSYAVTVEGNYAYINIGPRLAIVDISTPYS